MLVDVLNRLSGERSDPQKLAQAAGELTAEERREAAILHLSALVEHLPDAVSGDAVEFPGMSLDLVAAAKGECDICYEDIDAGFKVVGGRLTRSDGPSTMSGLIDLLLEARSGSDVLLYLPADMRKERIEAMTARVQASERFVRFMLARAPAIERAIAA